MAPQARTLFARQAATGAWFQVIGGSATKTVDEFTAEVARQFGVPAAQIVVEVVDLDTASREQAARDMGRGTYQGRPVLRAPPAPPAPGEGRRRMLEVLLDPANWGPPDSDGPGFRRLRLPNERV